MATKVEKDELIDILKFTPVTVRMYIQGYGGESYAGKVDRKIYEFFKEKRIDISEYANDWDDNFSSRVPEDMRPFYPGSPYDCDNLFHASGAELSDLNTITVEDDNGKTVWEHSVGYSDLEDAGVTVEEGGGADIYEHIDENQVVFWGGQGEKGCFFDGEFTLRAPFDPKKLRITFENCDDWYIINYVEYDGEEIDGSGGYSTTGKWTEQKWCLPDGEEDYEPVSVEDFEDEDTDEESLDTVVEAEEDFERTPWYSAEVKPAHKGEYEVDLGTTVVWPFARIVRAEWTGRTWKDMDGKKIQFDTWRGLAFNPEVN